MSDLVDNDVIFNKTTVVVQCRKFPAHAIVQMVKYLKSYLHID